MIEISKRRSGQFWGLWTVSLTATALLYPMVSPGSGAAWAQERRLSPVPSMLPVAQQMRVAQEKRAVQKKPDPSPVALPVREPMRVTQEKRAVQRKPDPLPVAHPVREPTGGALGTALASCEQGSENSEALTLPGARGEVKLDRCYRGRDHLVCSLNALLGEASSLIEQYGRIVEAHYTDVNNLAGVCGMKPDALATDLQNANDFTNRFKALKAEYDARSNCGNRIVQSLKDVTLPDMAQAPEILKSMIDSLEGDLKGVSVVQTKVVELAERVDSSRKAISTIQKIHRTMCVKDQRALSQISDSTIR